MISRRFADDDVAKIVQCYPRNSAHCTVYIYSVL